MIEPVATRAGALARAALALASALATTSKAATIQKVNKDFTQIIVGLSSAELAAVEADTPVVFEFGKDGGVASGTVDKINVVKKSALITLDAPDKRLKRKQDLRFLSFFWNPVLSPLTYSYAQYHQYSHSSLEAAARLFGTDLVQKVGDGKSHTTADGVGFELDGYMIFNPSLVGAGFGIEHREVLFATFLGDAKATSDLSLNRLKPGIWIEVEPHWRVSLRYDYTAMAVKYGSRDDVISYDFAFYEPHVGVVWYERDFEAGIHYKDRDSFKAVDSDLTSANVSVTHKQTRTMPAELDFHFRDVVSPLFIWGGSLGYVFHERTSASGEALEPMPAPYEMLRLGTSFEHRLSQGSKLDWKVALEGAKVPTLTTTAREVNTLGGAAAFYHMVSPGLVLGGMAGLAGGIKDDRVQTVDPTTGAAAKRSRQATGFLFDFQLQARYELDVGGTGRRRR